MWGAMISFLGSLPLGTLNIAAMQLGIQESIKSALYFSFGSLLVEMIYVRISLIGISWIRKQERLMKIMEWVTFCIVLALAIGSYIAAIKGGENAKNPILDNNMHRFLLGALGCAVNPIVVIFWFGWSTVLFTKKILKPINSHYNSYIVGIGLGAFAGNCVFIFGGNYLYNRITDAQHYMHWLIAFIFTITAFVNLYKILRKKKGETALAEEIKKDEEIVEKINEDEVYDQY